MSHIKIVSSAVRSAGEAELFFEINGFNQRYLYFYSIAKAANIPASDRVLQKIRETIEEELGGGVSTFISTNLGVDGEKGEFISSSQNELLAQAKRLRRVVRDAIRAAKEAWESDTDKITDEWLEERFPMDC